MSELIAGRGADSRPIDGPRGGGPSFAGRSAVVTGGAHGIGAAIARRLVALGAQVMILDREPEEDCAPTIHVDLADPTAVLAAVERVSGILPRVDVLVNCAGISYVAALVDLDLEMYRHLLAVNLDAPILLMRAFAPTMAAAGYGRIVNITSVHARVSEPGCLAYDISKAGLEAATRVAAVELSARGVLVNAVAPGFVATRLSVVDGVDELQSDWFRTVYREYGQLPIARAAAPDEIADPVCWLASEANSYTSGQVLVVDGGLTIRL